MPKLFPLGAISGFAAAFILLGTALFLRTLRFRAKAQPVDARIVKAEDFGTLREDGLIAVRISYEYTAPDGRVIQADRTSLRWHIPPVGSSRAMLVDPEKPKRLQRPGIREYLMPFLLVIAGIIILLIPVVQF